MIDKEMDFPISIPRLLVKIVGFITTYGWVCFTEILIMYW